jgi:hypothetical protein
LLNRISLNEGHECAMYTPTPGEEFGDPVFIPASREIIVANTGNQPTGKLNVILRGNEDDLQLFELSPAVIENLNPGEKAALTIKTARFYPKEQRVYRVELLVGGENSAGKIPVTYTVFSFVPAIPKEVTITADARPKAGASGSVASTTRGDKPWFSSDPAVAAISAGSTAESAALALGKAGEAVIGYIETEADGNMVVKGKRIKVYPADWTASSNIARSAAVTAEDSAGNDISHASYPVANLIDGDANTRWASSGATRACGLTLSFSSPVKAGSFKILAFGTSNSASSGRITGFKIQYDDGGVWNDAYAYTGPSPIPGSGSGSGNSSYNFAVNLDKPVSSGKFRLSILTADEAPSIWEFELWNNPLEFMN